MAQGDYGVKVSSQELSFAQDQTQTLINPNLVSEVFATHGLPRAFCWFRQTSPGPSALVVTIEWAIRMNAANTPDFLPLQVLAPLAPAGAPSSVLLTTGALWLRFSTTVPGGGLETVQIRAAAFV